MALDRRLFLKLSGVVAAGACASSLPVDALNPQAAANEGTPLKTFGYGDVQLLDGPMKQQFDETHSLFLNLDEDRLLKVFRQKAGMPAPGDDMGGWYDGDAFDLQHDNWRGFVPGHTFGQYVSALSRAYAVTGSQPTRAKVHRLVNGYAATVDPKASFFIDYRLPAYTYDKLSCGLIDAREFAQDPTALAVHEKLTRGVVSYLPEKALSRAEQRARPHKDESYTWDESYTLPENFFLAYHRSGNVFYRQLGSQFLEDDTYFNALSRNINVLVGEHAYSHMNAFSSAMQAYLTLGSQKHLQAARNGFAMVVAQSFAPGGWGPDEAFVDSSKGHLGASLEKSHSSFETPCGAYAHFKITRYLMQVERDPHYGDSMERVLYNTILGAKPILPDGITFYYSDYATTGKKVYYREKWPCCSGTFPQLAADYHISIYLRAPDGVYVNLFAPSTLRWTTGSTKCTLTQETKYPFDNRIRMLVSGSQPAEYTLYLRIPAWTGPNPILAVNGKRVSEPVQPGTFAAIRRTWKDGDRVDLELPMPLRLESVDAQHPVLVALVRGPLVLFAVADSQPTLERSALLAARATNNSTGDWMVQSVTGQPVTFRPFMSIGDENYSTYVALRS